MLFHWIVNFVEFFIVSWSRRNCPSCLSCTFLCLIVISSWCSINSKYFAVTTLLGCLHHIFIGAAVLYKKLGLSADIQTRRSCCRLHHLHLLLLLRYFLIVILSWRVQTPVNLDWLSLCSLDNRVARSFLWSVLGTHARLCLDSSMRAAISVWNLNLLVSVLGASLSHNTMSCRAMTPLCPILHDNRSIQSNLWCTAYNRSGSRKSLSSASNLLVNQLLLNNCRLISRSNILNFIDALTAARIATQVPDLPDVAASTSNLLLCARLDIVQKYSINFLKLFADNILSRSLRGACHSCPLTQIIRLDKLVLLHEEVIIIILCVCSVGNSMAKLSITALVTSLCLNLHLLLLMVMLFNSGTTACLASDRLNDYNIVTTTATNTLLVCLNVHLVIGCRRLSPLARRRFIYSSGVLGCPICHHRLVWSDRIRSTHHVALFLTAGRRPLQRGASRVLLRQNFVYSLLLLVARRC